MLSPAPFEIDSDSLGLGSGFSRASKALLGQVSNSYAMKKPFATGLAFGAGFLLAPGLIWLVLGVAAAVLIGIVTHLWILYVLAVGALLFVGSAFISATRQLQTKSKRGSLEWAHIHNAAHDPTYDSSCPLCISGTKARRSGPPITDSEAAYRYAALPKTVEEQHVAWHTQWHTGCSQCDLEHPEDALRFYEDRFTRLGTDKDRLIIEGIKSRMEPGAYAAHVRKRKKWEELRKKHDSSTT